MQWIALEENQNPITASHAIKRKRYGCPECAAIVQLRSGPHRQAHFYHLRKTALCTQHRKTEEHLRLQLSLAAGIPLNQASIERPFPEIKRIADVAWEEKKIAFEIQCSPISMEEAKNRCEDYRSIGWEVLWILSDRRFNRRRLSAAEHFLRDEACYFSNRKGQVYDQCEILQGFHRVYKGRPIPIDPLLACVHVLSNEMPSDSSPLFILQRMRSWKLRVAGDALSQALSSKPPTWMLSLHALEKRICKQNIPMQRLAWSVLLKCCYLQVLKKILRLFSVRKL